MICIGLACLAISRGVSSIEPVNRVIVPTLLLIVVFTFYWALFMPYGGMGIIHMFSPSWSKSIIYILYYCNSFPIESFGNADLWRDALTQNAWDTGTRASNMAYSYYTSSLIGAGGALFLTYATYMKREQGVVKLGSTTPALNNLVRYR